MDAAVIVICLSTGFQLLSAFFAAKLLLQPGRRIAGLITFTVILLMAFRRFVSLYRLITVGGVKTDFFAETLALIISFLILIGVLYLSRLIESERKMASLLADSKQHYQTLFNLSPYGIVLVDMKGNIIESNETAARDLGYTREEFSGLHLSDINPYESREAIQGMIEAVRKSGKGEFEVKHRTKGGDLRDVHVITQIVDFAGGKISHSIWRDITERRRAEKDLREKEEKYKLLFESANDGIFIHDETGFVDCNQRGAEMYGLPKEQIIGRHPGEFAPERQPDGRLSSEVAGEKIRAALSGGPQLFEWRPVRADGSPFDVEITLSRLEMGGRTLLQAIVRDISGRKQAEEAKDRLLRAVSAATEGIAMTDANDRFVYVNDAHARIYGRLQAELIGRTWRDAVPADAVPLVEKELGQTLHNRDVGIWSGFCPVIRKDGTVLPTEVTATSRWDEMGNYLGHICIVRDITERKRAEERIRESEQFIRNILDSVDECFIVVDRDFRILTANKAYCSQAGRPCDEVIGRHCFEVSHKMNRPCYEEGEDCAVRRAFDTGEPHTALHRHTDAGGALLYVETKAYPVRDGSGAVTSVIETITNMTEKHLLEEERLKTQKLEAIGTLAGGIAHDFNNLLQGIFGYISLAKMTVADKERTHAMLEQAEQALHMSVNLTTQLLTFSKGGKPVKTNVCLRPLIESSARFALSGSRVDYSIRTDDDLWAAEVDRGQFGQVIQNIVLNADQAMPDGGTIEITAKNVQAPKKGLPRLPGGRYVEIAVRDTGIGIPANYLQKIFDPYFTTKEKGSGLGLATSYSIIRNHGGLIDVVSEPGMGTTFYIYFPAVEAESEVEERPAFSPSGRRGKILIMDDDELVRNVAGSFVMTLGHEVDTAGDGEAAIAKYRSAMQSGRPFDIVLLDLTVRGGLGGRETVERLRSIDPDVRAIVSTGYSDNDVIADYQKYGFMARLAKPYDMENLRTTMDSLLGNRP